MIYCGTFDDQIETMTIISLYIREDESYYDISNDDNDGVTSTEQAMIVEVRRDALLNVMQPHPGCR